MFLAGADGQTPELRAPSIKGAMRFWWRALNGHLVIKDDETGNWDYSELQKREGEIFGDTEHGKSKIIVRVMNPPPWDGYNYSPTPHNPRFRKSAFEPGVDFSLKVSLTKNLSFEDGSTFLLKQLAELFLITATLGGFGGRTRRGFGTIDAKIIDGPIKITMPRKAEDLLKLLPQQNFKMGSGKIISNLSFFPPYPIIKRIEIGSPVDTSDSLLEKIGKSSSQSKSSNNDSWDYKNSLGHTSKRFSSPVFVSVIHDRNQYFPIISTLNTVLDQGRTVSKVHEQIQETFKSRIL